jgi:hypothetical protein
MGKISHPAADHAALADVRARRGRRSWLQAGNAPTDSREEPS